MKFAKMFVLSLSLVIVGLSGCAEKSTTKTEKTVSTPGGSTSVTTETEVKKSGDNPPAATK